MPGSKRKKGNISSWNDEKGFGFISPDAGKKQVFIHIKSITNLDRNKNRRPQLNQRVSYNLSTDNQGRQCAENSTLAGGKIFKVSKMLTSSIPLISIITFFGVVGLAVYMSKIPPFILAFYLLFSLITFIIYAVDKSAARHGNWRTKETSLHILSLAGGWPGALLAQKIIRHKTRKQPFLTIFWITAAVNGGVFIYILSPGGAEMLQTIIQSIVWALTTTVDQ